MRGMNSGLCIRLVSILLGFTLAACGGSNTSVTPAAFGSAPAATGGSATSGSSAAAAPVEADPLSFSASNYSIAQDASLVYLTIIRVGSAASAVSINYSTVDGTALAGTDYSAASGMLQWEENDSSPRTVFVPLISGAPYAGTKSFTVALTNPSAAAQIAAPDRALVTITGSAGTAFGNLQFSDPVYTVNQASQGLLVTVNRTNGLSGSTSVQFSTTDATALAGIDYTATSGTLDWSAGDGGSRTFVIPLLGGLPYSGTKSFGITLSDPTAGAALGFPSVADVTITGSGSPSAGTFELSAPSDAVAQNAGTVTVTVQRTGGSSGQASVGYSTSGGSAVPGSDFTAASGVLTWADGDSAPQTVAIGISPATPFSGNRVFSVGLFDPIGGATIGNPGMASITIAGSAAPALGSVQLSLSSYIVAQGSGLFSAGVERIGGSSGAVSVQYSTQDGSALAGTDYSAATGVLQWADGDSSPKVLNIPVSAAALFSGTRSFSILLSNAGGGTTIGNPGRASVTIEGGALPAAAALHLSLSSYVVAQGSGLFSASVERTGDSSGSISVQYSTQDGSALGGVDYSATSGLLQWADGDSSPKVFNIPVSTAVPFFGTKSFSVVLSDPTGAANIDTPGTAAVAIVGAASTPNAAITTPAAAFLSYAATLKATGKLLVGQHSQYFEGNTNDETQAYTSVTPLYAQTGQLPAILGVTANWYGTSDPYHASGGGQPDLTVVKQIITDWDSASANSYKPEAGAGIVQVNWGSVDPTGTSNGNFVPISSAALAELVTPGSAYYDQWVSETQQLQTWLLSVVAQNPQVVLMVRLFAELNGNWYWYGVQNSQTDVNNQIKLHQQTFNTLFAGSGASLRNNVLISYNANNYGGFGAAAAWPGKAYADLAGWDMYDAAWTSPVDPSIYNAFVAFGVPLIQCEVGITTGTGNGPTAAPIYTVDNMLIPNFLRSHEPAVIGYVQWDDNNQGPTSSMSITLQNHASELMNESFIVTLADLPTF
jgi:hypothetical protein